MGYSPRGHKESDTTERLRHTGILYEGSSVPWLLLPEATCKLLPWSVLSDIFNHPYFERRKETASPPRRTPELMWCLRLFALMRFWLPTPAWLMCWALSGRIPWLPLWPKYEDFLLPSKTSWLWQQLSWNLHKMKNNYHRFTDGEIAAGNETGDSFQAANIGRSDKNEIPHQMNLTPKPISISTKICMTNAYFNHSCWATQTKPPILLAKSWLI